MVTEKQIFKEGYAILRAAKIEYSEFDAKQLFENAFCHKITSPLFEKQEADAAKSEKFLSDCKRRANREPLQYILGNWEFYSLPFYVNENVLIPRADTEIAVEAALKYVNDGDTVYDFCCGSGCIGITVAKYKKCNMTLFDISEQALSVARKNTVLNGVFASVERLDVLNDIAKKKADVIISNPPYLDKSEMESLQPELRHEPSLSLFGGDDGLDFYRALAVKQKQSLKLNGLFILEIGENQAKSVTDIFTDNGYERLELINDYSGNNRVLIFRNIF
ncbi:MAG: peptide chain release factor N(5)-glutamine methyltransferase [Clostridia bacterium]|nr:peptide chain release factor N(5)-glutamine methyltransferase [Clostridia bacterium]